MSAEDVLRLVDERLEFVDMLSELQGQYFDPNKIRGTPEGGWTHPWKYFDALRNYLLLTCFDLLGQPAEYKDFQSWLTSASSSRERVQVKEKLILLADPIEIARQIHGGYQSLYGVRKSFVRFIEEVLRPEDRRDLLYSVRIRRIDREKNVEIEVIESEEKKIGWLYHVRNSYTHRAQNTGSAAAGVFSNWPPVIIIDGKAKMGWEPIDWEHKDNFYLEYGVRNWPEALRAPINAVLAIRQEQGTSVVPTDGAKQSSP